MRYLLPIVTIMGLVIVGCSDRHRGETSQSNQQQSKLQESTIPSDVSFSLIDSSTLPSIKRRLDVRLNRRVSEQTLRVIALKLKAQDSGTYDRTFMFYYLPGMTVSAGAWATTHFTPDLEVRILGLTAEAENKLVTQPQAANREVIGRWLDDTPLIGNRTTIFREKGKLFMEHLFKDGSNHKTELIERKSPLGRRFDKVKSSRAADHWVLDSNGNLQVRDNDGLIATLMRIE